VQQVEAAVGQYNTLARPPPGGDLLAQLLAIQDLFRHAAPILSGISLVSSSPFFVSRFEDGNP
jgi:hypothetical protein